MTARLLLEIGVEEMPASAARSGLEQLLANGLRLLAENRLLDGDIARENTRVFGTPRRLTWIVEELPAAQKSEVREVKGPPAKIAFGDDGAPAPAAIGFAKSQGIDVRDIEVREVDGGKYLFAVRESVGLPTLEVLPDILAELVNSLEFTKAMRWGTGQLRFIRPIRWLLSFYGSHPVSFELDGLRSGRQTFGHRFLAEGPFELTAASEYEAVLKNAKVLLDHEMRRASIKGMIEAAAEGVGGRAFADPADIKVLDEVVFLVEDPHVVVGEFDEGFLRVPRAALVTAMKSHQRYLPLEDRDGQLMAKFAIVHNGDPAYEDQIRRGHERVLRARLADAAFFFSEDTKSTLESKVDDLGTVVWQAKLGTVRQKTERVQKLAARLASQLELLPDDVAMIERAALLAKGDLTTSMVIEFPDLQGVIGREYALVDGEDNEVAQAVFEHYLPRFAGDDLPGGLVGRVVAVADKLDTLAGCFLAGLIPTGSADPYSLRRQAAGAVQILAQTGWSFDILDLTRLAIAGYEGASVEADEPEVVAVRLNEFVLARLRRLLGETGATTETIDAVLSSGRGVVADVIARVRLVNALEGKTGLEDIKIAFTRCHNLAQQELGEAIDEDLFEDVAEERLFGALMKARDEIAASVGDDDLDNVVRVLASLRPRIDEFFEAVMVMADDERVKNNRLRLLNICVGLSEEIADFSKLP